MKFRFYIAILILVGLHLVFSIMDLGVYKGIIASAVSFTLLTVAFFIIKLISMWIDGGKE